MKQMKENEELKRLNEVSFMLNDLAVYLDEHPSDGRAAEWFEVYDDARKEILENFEKESWRG